MEHSLRHISLCIEHISTAQQTVTFEFLCAVCLLHEQSWKCDLLSHSCLAAPDASPIREVLQGLDFFRLLKPDAWLHVLKSVRENLEFKTAYFMLVNTIIAQSDDIKSRNKVREVYMSKEVFALMKVRFEPEV